MAEDEACSEIGVNLRVEDATLQVVLSCDSDLSTGVIDAVQTTAVGRVDRTEIDGSNRTITLTKTSAR